LFSFRTGRIAGIDRLWHSQPAPGRLHEATV